VFAEAVKGTHVAAHCTDRRVSSHRERGVPSTDNRALPIRAPIGGEMASITRENRIATLINVFTVDPKDQQQLVDLLTEATERTIKHLPGFVSASIHKSTDGARVVNYAQWRSRDDLSAMLENPAAQEHIRPIMEIARADPHLYDVVDTVAT
jgi:quinol monooxygenase YgiN